MRKRLALLTAAAVLLPTAAVAAGGGFHADLDPVPHDHVADGGSDVQGHADLALRGTRLTIDLRATGLTPNEPHAMHIHGELAALNECPDPSADADGDGLISLQEAAPDYGPIDVSLTTSGDTSAASGLALERFPVADAHGVVEYHRTVTIPKDLSKKLGELHVVLHGTALPDGDDTSLTSLFEATLPVACGTIDRSGGAHLR
ncbi:hypothetical protein [Cellulomonas endophytica]|uniref:hypothetical protein n=1 Tax=Cellulomonas endophytica TaxID=2494735 RepID=UPI0010136302|nr:hypothetical protein [Cellulomonas endophytica]